MQRTSIGVSTVEVPATLEQATSAAWLEQALAPISNGSRIAKVELAELLQAMASKVRIAVTFANDLGTVHRFCLKAFLDSMHSAGGGETTLREGRFYSDIAPELSMRTPACPVVVVDEKAARAILIMEDLVEAGAHFYTALEPFSLDLVSETLDQLARLHARADLLSANPWIPARIDGLAKSPYFPVEETQQLMLDERRGNLPDRTLDAGLMMKGLAALATRNASRPRTLLHGDVHAGNVYAVKEGPGFTDWQLIQRGHWALDVAYHIVAVLPTEVSECEERRLLDHYLDCLRKHGGTPPSAEQAWEDYRCSQVVGYYLWAITRRVRPVTITHQAFQRLGAGVTRHETYNLLGL